MKTRNYIYRLLFTIACLLPLILIVSACFAPLGYKSGDTTLSVGFGGGSLPRTVINPDDLHYEITFSGPGGRTITETANYGETVTVQVVPGKWSISVLAFEPATPGTTRAIGETNDIDVKVGVQNETRIKMAVYTEVSTWAGLKSAIEEGGDYNEYIVIDGPIDADSTITSITSSNPERTITLVSNDSSKGIIRRNGFNALLFDIANNNILILGSITRNLDKTLTINGGNAGTDSFFRIRNGSTLIMNNQAVLEYNARLAITCEGNFTMNGGSIRNNGTISEGFGGVNVTGVFTMKGGTIGPYNSGNNGGGINISNGGNVYMEGGTITGNTASTTGGGVTISDGGTFTMSGGEIHTNTCSTGNGIFNAGTFNMSGSALIAASNDVHLPAGKTITVTGTLTSVAPVATIQLPIYTVDTVILNGNPSLLAENHTKFNIVSNGLFQWSIHNGGKLGWKPFAYIDMVQVLAGSFTMGSLNNNDIMAQPPHQVTLTQGFYMGIYQVTQEQYQAVMGSNPSRFQGPGNLPALGEEQSRRPVERVSWYDAIEFCNRLSMLEGLDPVYSLNGSTDPSTWVPQGTEWNTMAMNMNANGYRLPIEAEWEYACKAGTDMVFNPAWDGSNTYTAPGWYNTISDDKTHEVGKRTANNWGLHDMHGNVLEWCWDWASLYTSEAKIDPIGPDTGTARIMRGGSYYQSSMDLRVASRPNTLPAMSLDYIGFRLVRR